MKKIPVIMDVDTGIDDAVAIILAANSPELEILGITTVRGNNTIRHTTQNTLDVLALLKKEDIPVYKGASRPLVKEARTSEGTHGDNGLGNVVLPKAKNTVKPEDAITFMRRAIEESREKVTLVPTGPLTNVALLLLAYPHLKEKIEKIVMMGGGAFTGNMTPSAEFNIFIDPEAAKVVIESGLPIVLCGLDITNKAYTTQADIDQIRALDNDVSNFCADALQYYFERYTRNPRFKGCAINDAVAVAYLTHPEIITTKKCRILVDIDGKYTYACTACDFRPDRDRSLDNGKVGLDIDREKFIELLVNACKAD